MKKPAKTKMQRAPDILNGFVYCLVALAVCLGGIATWRWYVWRRQPDEAASEARHASAERTGALVPDAGLAEGLTWAGGPGWSMPSSPGGPFVCPQCRSSCWSPPGSGRPACPFCGSAMVRQGPAVAAAAGTPAGGAGATVVIGPGAIRPHGDRGICANCHTMAAPGRGISISLLGGAPVAAAASPIPIRPDATRPHVDRGACANCHTILPAGASWRGGALAGAQAPGWASMRPVAATPAIGDTTRPRRDAPPPVAAPGAGGATLVKEFGIEVCPAPGSGAMVSGVMGNSHAANAGLRTGDIIIECNGTRVRGVEQFQQLVSRAAPETDAQIRIIRDRRALDLLIMVGEGEMEGFTPIRRL